MSLSVNEKVTSFKKILVENIVFPDFILNQLNVVEDAERKYNESLPALTKNRISKKDLKEAKDNAVKSASSVISLIYNSFKLKKEDKKRSLYFGTENATSLKKDLRKMRDVIAIMLDTQESKQEAIINFYKSSLEEAKSLLDIAISNGNLIGNQKFLVHTRDKAIKNFEEEFLRLKFYVMGFLIKTGIDYKIFFHDVSRKKVKSEQKESKN